MAISTEQQIVSDLRERLRGEVIDREHASYDEARCVWNGLIDRRPAVIARCANVADVVECVRIAQRHRPVVSIRGGGHQIAGSAVCDDGLVIDLSQMKGIEVDPSARTARAEGGVHWGELDRATQGHGLVTPGGEISVTGIAGLTLGGGLGITMRAYGLSCDTLREIEIVTADGEVRTASRDEHPDLFWAARGGGRGLGVVTAFTFDLHPLGPQVASATYLYPYEDAREVIRAYVDAAHTFPDEVTPELIVIDVPPVPDFPEELHGERVVIVQGIYAGPVSEGEGPLSGLGELGTPLGGEIAEVPYADLQSGMDALFPDGNRYYFKSHFMDEVTDEAIEALLAHDAERPDLMTLFVLRTMGGAITRADDSAFAHRSAAFNLSLDTQWEDPGQDEPGIGWARSTWDAMKPFASGGVYVNFSGLDEEADELRGAVQGGTEQRLVEVRRAYDPEGILADAARRP